jgi:hypothetical protein
MRSFAEAMCVWIAVMAPGVPLVAIGGSFGFGATVCLVLCLLWVAPWQGLSYSLPASAQREQLPIARTESLPASTKLEHAGGPPPRSSE